VHLVAATVVRLVGTLAHGNFSEGFEGCPLHCEISARPGSGNFGRHRPPTWPPGGGSWTCGTRRHGATGQWYAVGKRGVKPTRTTRRRRAAMPVDDVLPDPATGCYVPGVRSLLKTRSHQGSRRTVSRVTRPATVPLTCTNIGGTSDISGSRRPTELVGPSSSQLVDNSVDHGRARCPA
jgi:hypothetical protein